jgi:hypothetical protein
LSRFLPFLLATLLFLEPSLLFRALLLGLLVRSARALPAFGRPVPGLALPLSRCLTLRFGPALCFGVASVWPA